MKVPKARKLKSGSWFIQLRLDGESIPVTANTEQECIRRAELIKAEYRNGKRIERNKAASEKTLRQLCEEYTTKCAATISPATLRAYEAYTRSRFALWMDKPVKSIKWQKMIDAELNDVSAKYVKNAWSLCKSALKSAGLEVPEVRLAPVEVNEIPFLQPEEIPLFCAAVKGRKYEIPVLLELHGLRLSEARALTWDLVDLKRETITVKGARVRGPKGEVNKKTNKNETSTRTVPILIPQLLEALKAAKPEDGGEGVRICSQDGSTLLEDVKRACRYAGVTETTNHGLRHSFASLCYFLRDKGVSERQCMSWAGWKDYHTMHKIYIRLAATAEVEAAKAVKAFFEPPKKPKRYKMLTNLQKARKKADI